MWFLSRLRARRSLDAASAEALLAGRGIPPGAPADQQALAQVLEIAAGPGSAQELAGEVAAAAVFVQVTTQAKPHRSARRALAVAACAVAVGGTAAVYATLAPAPHHKIAPVPFGVPAEHHTLPATTAPPRPPGRPTASPGHRNPGVPHRAGSP